MNSMLKKLWMVFAILIILAAVCTSIFRALTPWAKQYKGEVEHHLSVLIGQPVSIETMETGWYWFQPVLKLKHVSVNEGQGKSLRLNYLVVGIDLFKSLWHWNIQPGVLYIDDIHLVLREKEGLWQIDGLSTAALDGEDMTPERTQQLLVWLAEQEKLIIRHLSAHVHFSDGSLIPISGFNLFVVNRGGHYTLKGEAKLAQTNATSFQLLGDLHFNPYRLDKTKGQIYFSAKRILPAQWQSIFPQMSQHLEGGKGDLALWVDFEKGRIASVQAQIKLKRLAWRLLDNKNSQLIQDASANLIWKPSDLGWQLHADKIQLRVGDIKWPENQLFLKFDKTLQSYQFFIKSIILESISTDAINWPKAIEKIISQKPQGLLTDTQVIMTDSQLSYLLTRFDNLGWNAVDDIPKVTNLSGVLNWQPEEGRLELDSENSTIAIKNYPTQNLSLLNGSLEWKELSDGLRVSLDRFVLSQPELTLSAEGAFSGVSSTSLGHVRLLADFSAKNIQSWFPYLPKEYLKPNLLAWLKNNMKQIAEATGKLQVNGMAKDFPFDKPTEGEFNLICHASGGELLLGPEWQPIKELEGYIKVNHRELDIDLIHGDFQGLPLSQMNLRIPDIGKDRETLLIHGKLNTQAQKVINFIKTSPLNMALSSLNTLSMKGLLSLNLNMELPLYYDNAKLLAEGEVNFDQNTLLLKHPLGDLNLDDFSGALFFNESGVTHSALTASVFGSPWDINIQSIQSKNPYTRILFSGEYNFESLKNHLQAPIFSLFKGVFFVKAELKLTKNPNEFDHLSVDTDLQGLKINLPAPIGKTYNAKLPLKVNLDFSARKGTRLKANYNNLISTDLLFQSKKNAFAIQSGQIKLGGANALDQHEKGFAIVGKLDAFPLHEWSRVVSSFWMQDTRSTLLDNLRIIDVSLGKLNVLNQQWNQLAIKAKMLANQDWNFNIEQTNISGDLNYRPQTKTVSGHIKRLHLVPFKTDNQSTKSFSRIYPEHIPNLDLRIDNFSFGEMKIGDMTLKSQSSKTQWLLDSLRIDSPVYQFFIQGDWTRKENINRTKMQVKWHVTDLAKSLERWQITPVVNASKGDLEFTGGWNNSVFDFSLASLNGTMKLQFNNGEITHLSKETEEKLGLGKLLSILSLQTIPRRLKLDFSDLSHKGYSFDIFKGNFIINKGIMSTQDSYLDGPVAYASMKGELNLPKRMYDLNLRISPHITASLPLVATIAGGPIAGLAVWVANKIINQGMQKISAYSYKISGPWEQPVVQQLSIVRQTATKK